MPHCSSTVLRLFLDQQDGWDAIGVTWHPMNLSNLNEFSGAESLDLSGITILVVEDSWQLAMALKSLLQALGAEVSGPVATSADAQRLVSERTPDAALVDFNLRGGEQAVDLIDRLNDQGVYVIVTSGYATLPVAPRHPATILQKPISETQLLARLRPVVARKAQR
jgi:DNA-binding response OmpR family regulator